MDQITIEYGIKALESKIRRVTEVIQVQKRIQAVAERDLALIEKGVKERSDGGMVSVMLYKDDSESRLAQAKDKIDRHTRALANYRHALDQMVAQSKKRPKKNSGKAVK